MNSSLVDDLLLQLPIPPELWCPAALHFKFTSSQALTACCVIANADQEVFVGFSPWDRGTTLLGAESGLDCTPQTLIGWLYFTIPNHSYMNTATLFFQQCLLLQQHSSAFWQIAASMLHHHVRVQAVNIWYYCVVIEGHLLWHRPIKEYSLQTSCI